MMKAPAPTLLIIFLIIAGACSCAQQKKEVVVSADGSGDYTTVQGAVDDAPDSLSAPYVILIKRGVYREKIFIEKSFITLAGEDRENTKIIYPELRRNWNKAHKGNDSGAAVINIANGVTDLTIVNVTVHNNYGSLHENEEFAHDHQFAIRGGGKRVIIINSTVISDGGDALSLWNSLSGMYYHAFCKFEGWVDYVCPRGWCYITDSEFFGHNLTASIWHDGSFNESQKFVIKRSLFDGVKNFPLGRNHRDAAFYLIGCSFSENLADRPIYRARGDSAYRWTERYYYSGCSRSGGNYKWFENNIDSAESANKYTAAWTFDAMWNPESPAPEYLPLAYCPSPQNGSKGVSCQTAELKWTRARNAVAFKVYVGEGKDMAAVSVRNETSFRPKDLKPGKKYFWRVDTITKSGTVAGPLWDFSTK